MPDESKGPFLTMASFCELALQETDRVFSAIRMVDMMTLTVEAHEGKPTPTEIPPVLVHSWFLIKFASLNLSADYELLLSAISPSGKETEIIKHMIRFDPDGLGSNVRVELNIGVKEDGVFWFHVRLNGELITQVPLKVKYELPQGGESEKT